MLLVITIAKYPADTECLKIYYNNIIKMKSIFKHFLLVFSLLSVQFSIAQTPTVENITPIGWSGNFKFINFLDGGKLFAAADNGYLYLSLDT